MLFDVSPVTYPAYSATTSAVGSNGGRSAPTFSTSRRTTAIRPRPMTKDERETWGLMALAGRRGDDESARQAYDLLREFRRILPGAQDHWERQLSDRAALDLLDLQLLLDDLQEPTRSGRRPKVQRTPDYSEDDQDRLDDLFYGRI